MTAQEIEIDGSRVYFWIKEAVDYTGDLLIDTCDYDGIITYHGRLTQQELHDALQKALIAKGYTEVLE